MFRYIYCLVLLFICVTNVQGSSNPSWVTHPSFTATKLTIQLNDTNQKNQSVNYTLTKSFGDAPKVALGIIGWDSGVSSEPVAIISFNITREKVTGTDIVITYNKPKTVAHNSKFDISVLVVDPSFKHINIAFAIIKFNIINTPSQQQTQEQTDQIMLSSDDIQQNHEYQIVPFITSINLQSSDAKGDSLGVSLTLKIIDSSFYSYKFIIDGTNKLSDASFYRILCDKSVTKQSQGNLFIDLNFIVTEYNKQNSLKSINSSIKSSLMGFNSFNFNKASKPNFQLQSNIVSGQFRLLNISFMQFRTSYCSLAEPLFDYKNQKCQAECPKGSYLISNSSTCQSCHQTCNSCSGPEQTDCIDCFATKGDVLDQQTHKCVCNNLVNGKCVFCNQTCLTCDESGSKCTSCNTKLGFTLKDGACVCDGENSILTEDGACTNCTNLHGSGCLYCNLEQCLSCSQNFTLSSSSKKCVCNQGFTLIPNQGTCRGCSQIKGCISCTNLSFCTSCQPKMNLMNGQCFCPSISQFYNEDKKQCLNCRGSCLICQSEDRCLVCRSEKNLIVNTNYQCVCPPYHAMNQTLGVCVRTKCQPGYKFQLNTCTQICGDGKVFELQCDDGNIADGDGCSSSCQVEKGYKCQNGTPTSPSICRFQNNLKFTLLQSHKLQFQNKIILNFSISPPLQELNSLNFSQLISLNIPYSNLTYQYQNTSLILYVQTSNKFNETQNVKFLFAPPAKNFKLSAMRSSKEEIRLSRNLGQYVQSIVHELSYILKQVFIACSVIAVILCLKKNRKIISIQLISTLQLIYISLCIPSSILPLYRPWIKVGKLTNGYNMQIQPNVNIQSSLNNIGYFAYFIQNVNSMIAIQIAIFFFGYLLFKLGKMMDNRAIFKLGRFLYKNLFSIFVYFNIVNLGFSFGIDLTTANKPELSDVMKIWNYSVLPIALFSFSMAVFYSSQWRNANLDQKSIIKQRSIQKRHPAVLMLTKFFIAFLIGLSYSYENIGLIVELIQYLYITYILLVSPYKSKSDLYRSLINEITLIIHFGVLYGFVLDTDITTGQYLVFGLINILMIITTTILSLYCHCISQHLQLELVPLVSESVISSMDGSQRSNQEEDPDKLKESGFDSLQIKNEDLFDIEESPQVLT